MAAKKKKKAAKKSTRKSRLKKSHRKVSKKKPKARKLRTGKKIAKKGIPKARIIGVVTHYFPHVQAAVVKLRKPLATGDAVLLKGNTTNFEQKVESMQIDRVPIQKAKKGDEIGLQVKERVREHDLVLFPN